MKTMTDSEYREFMTGTARTGKLATVRKDGRPHVAPIWFVLDGDDMIFMTSIHSVKGKNILRDKRVSLCIDDETVPFAYVIFEGQAEVMELTPEEQLMWSTRIGGRYMGDDLAEQYGKRNAVPEEMMIRVKPTKVLAKTGISD